MNENVNNSRGMPILPIRSAMRVSVYKGEVYAAPPGFVCMGPDDDGRMWASNGESVIEMDNVGRVLEE